MTVLAGVKAARRDVYVLRFDFEKPAVSFFCPEKREIEQVLSDFFAAIFGRDAQIPQTSRIAALVGRKNFGRFPRDRRAADSFRAVKRRQDAPILYIEALSPARRSFVGRRVVIFDIRGGDRFFGKFDASQTVFDELDPEDGFDAEGNRNLLVLRQIFRIFLSDFYFHRLILLKRKDAKAQRRKDKFMKVCLFLMFLARQLKPPS